MRIRSLWPVVALAGSIACESKIHRLLESPPPPDVRLSVSVQPASLTVARGSELNLTATIVRIGDAGGPVTVFVDNVPTGITVSITTTPSASGATATINVRAAANAPVGNYSLTVRGRANEAKDATSLLVLSVIDPPDVAITLTQPSVTIARAGVARLGVALARTNISAPITLTLSGANGISAVFPGSPVTGNDVEATISVGASVAPGAYPMTVRATADGVDRTAALTVNVTADPLQVLAPASVAAPQLSTVSRDIIVNRTPSIPAASLSVDGLPAGVSAAFQPLATGNPSTSLTFAIAGTAVAGTYPLTIRASAAGLSDATAPLTLTVTPASITAAVTPATITVPAGGSTVAELSLTRRDFSGAVSLEAANLPTGVSVSFDSTSVLGSTATATVRVATSVAAGTYALSLRAIPAQLSPAAVQTATLSLRVTVPGAALPVTLDWSDCAAPTWVGFQDGAAPWSRLTSSNKSYQSSMMSPTGGVAYVLDNTVYVRYMTQAELTAGPLKLCPNVGARLVRGFAMHAVNGVDVNAYSLGGGFGTSSLAQPNFSISGVREGVHDLVAVTTFSGGAPSRILIRRDVPATATSLDTVNVYSADGVVPIAILPSVTVSGAMNAGETYSSTSSLMTTAACTVNPISTQQTFTASSFGNSTFAMNLVGVPGSSLRPTDYYLATATITGPGSSRTSTVAFQKLETRPLAFAPLLSAPAVSDLPGSYKRLQASVGSLAATFNRTVTLTYGDGRAAMSVVATRGYFDAANGIIAMPDLSGVAGWPSTAGVPSSGTGTWRVTADGSTSEGSACVENRMTFSSSRNGSY